MAGVIIECSRSSFFHQKYKAAVNYCFFNYKFQQYQLDKTKLSYFIFQAAIYFQYLYIYKILRNSKYFQFLQAYHLYSQTTKEDNKFFNQQIPYKIAMQSAEHFEKQMSSTNRKEKIFNVRRVHYKQFDHEKYLKPNFSPLQKKQHYYQHPSQKMGKKTGENHFQMQILTSVPYKQLAKKFEHLKQQQALQKQRKLREFRQKQQEHTKFKTQKEKLLQQKQRIMKKRDQLREKIQEIRQRNQAMRAQQAQRNEEYRIMNIEYFRDMIISMRYQNGVDIDPDRMTYEELLQLEQQMGSVSKGIPEQMIKLLPKKQFTQDDKPQLCSICYCDVKIGETINKLPCTHIYHFDCIKQWLKKERICPMCKQEIMERVDVTKQSNKENKDRNNRNQQNE